MDKTAYQRFISEIREAGAYIANHAEDFVCEHESIDEGSFYIRINVNPNAALPTVEVSREIIVFPIES